MKYSKGKPSESRPLHSWYGVGLGTGLLRGFFMGSWGLFFWLTAGPIIMWAAAQITMPAGSDGGSQNRPRT